MRQRRFGRRGRVGFAIVAALALVDGLSPGGVARAEAAGDPALVGAFAEPIQEPTGHHCANAQDRAPKCKPAAQTMAVVVTGNRILYWNGIEGNNKVKYNMAAEYGYVAENDQSRVLDLSGPAPTWTVPDPEYGGAEHAKPDPRYLPLVPHNNEKNHATLFCSSLVQLSNGTVLVAGGGDYYLEPVVPGTEAVEPDTRFGLTEVQGLRATRAYDPVSNTWRPAGRMVHDRWYPSLVTLPDGKVLAVGGVSKLIKPIYTDRPEESGRNDPTTETYDPTTETWTLNPPALRALPLYPRIHLLPDGNVYYDAAGQVMNPGGEGYDEALWHITSVYDVVKKAWKDLGVPMLGPVPVGFRGSSFSAMLPLRPDPDGRYTKAQFLSAGGVLGTWPGTYAAVDHSLINTVDTAAGHRLTSEATGPLNHRRWYSAGVVLPTGEVLAVNGSDVDETNMPGSGRPVRQAELFDPVTKKWTPVASDSRTRTYHSQAVLLPDGRVLAGGHAPFPTFWGAQSDFFRDNFDWTPPENDPTFSIYSPPYLFRGRRPVITSVKPSVPHNQPLTIRTTDAADISTVVLVRNPAATHLTDGDQRNVVVPVLSRTGDSLTVAIPGNTVLPPGPYMLFVNRKTSQGEIPSVSRQVFVGVPVPPALVPFVEQS